MADRYLACQSGVTQQIMSIGPKYLTAASQTVATEARHLSTDAALAALDPAPVIYTPGAQYVAAGLFARDFLYWLQFSAAQLVSATDIKTAADFLLLKQLASNTAMSGANGTYTIPAGSIPDHVYPDGRYSWGPGRYYGDVGGHFNRPSMDNHFCVSAIAWNYGQKRSWDLTWAVWFSANSAKLIAAYHAVPMNPATGLVTQWTTPGRTSPGGITETTGPCVMWGFHDSYGFGGDDLGCSVLAYNAASALGDMFTHAGDSTIAAMWYSKADALQTAIQARFIAGKGIPWGYGSAYAPTMYSPDLTGYAVWSGILSSAQADTASDYLKTCYDAGGGELFNANFPAFVRMVRKSDEVTPGAFCYPSLAAPYWNAARDYGRYQEGGYWSYMTPPIMVTLARKHRATASAIVGNQLASSDGNFAENIWSDGTLQNTGYLAAAALFGLAGV